MAITLAMIVLAFSLNSCTGDTKGFRIEGRLLSMNQADFLVYSPDGAISGIDTIHVTGGRFNYERPAMAEGTVIIVFPNFAVLPVFVKPGASISIDGNAAHLKETKVTGTDDNELFTEWRKNTTSLSPPDQKKQAEQFIKDHPASIASQWLLRQHFILCPDPDIRKARKLLSTMSSAAGSSVSVTRLKTALSNVGELHIGDRLPSFSARDIDGNLVTSQQYAKGRAVILVWTSWNYEAQNILRQLASNQKFSGDSLDIDNVLTICLDPDQKQCRKTLKICNAEKLTTICDGKMLQTPLLRTLALQRIPDDLKLQDGKVIGHSLPANALIRK